MSLDRYEMVVGLEVHVQLRTRSKAFCGCSTDFGAPPNTNTCPVCLALPGSLPVLNAQAVALATRAAVALACTVHPKSVFARKNYFYPDLPKGYQISQYDRPLATGGHLAVATAEGEEKLIGITRLHMEEDAGKSIHDRYPGVTAIDLNRAGVPLIEIVSEPDIRSAAEAGAYLRTLRQVLQYLDVSDVSMEEGSLRVDANVSARPKGESRLGTKTEVKNMNSFSGVERALSFEFARQCELLDRGEEVTQQTLLWDAAKGEARISRTKEGSHDYRYFPEPDLRPLILDRDWISKMEASIPELPAARKKRFAADYQLGSEDVEKITAHPSIADYFDMIRDGLVSHAAAKRVFALMAENGKPPAQIAHDEGLLKVGDDAALAGWIDEALSEHPEEARRFVSGERKLQGVLVGFVMKKSGGRADPKRVNQLLAARMSG